MGLCWFSIGNHCSAYEWLPAAVCGIDPFEHGSAMCCKADHLSQKKKVVCTWGFS